MLVYNLPMNIYAKEHTIRRTLLLDVKLSISLLCGHLSNTFQVDLKLLSIEKFRVILKSWRLYTNVAPFAGMRDGD